MTSQIIVKTDSEIKKAAMKMAKSQGINLTVVLNAFLKNYIKGQYQIDLIKIVPENDVTFEELFTDEEIVDKSNKISDYLHNKEL